MDTHSAVLPTAEERASYAADWPDNRRRVTRLSGRGEGAATAAMLEATVRALVGGAGSSGRGLLLEARRGDGVSWTAQAVLDVLHDTLPDERVAVFQGRGAAGTPPHTLELLGERASLRSARGAGLLAHRRSLHLLAVVVAILTLLAAGALLSFVAARLVAGGPLAGGRIIGALALTVLAPLVLFGARRVERRLDTNTDQFAEFVTVLDDAMRAAAAGSVAHERKVDAFVSAVSGRLTDRGTCSIYLVDEVDGLGAFDRRVLNRLLHTSTAEVSTIKRWFVLETKGEILAMRARAPQFTHLTALRVYRLLPLEPERIRALAIRRGIEDYDPLQVLSSLGAPHPLREHWRELFDEAVAQLSDDAEVGELHVLWMLAVGSTLEIRSALTRRELVSLLSSESHTRDVLVRQALSSGKLGNVFVRNALAQLTAGTWQSAFLDPVEAGGRDLVALRPDAARTIASRANERGLGHRGFAAAFWALYFDDHAASGHQRRTAQVSAHLEDAFHHHPDPQRLNDVVGGDRIVEVTARIARQCLDFAQLGHLASLVTALYDLADDSTQTTAIATQAYYLTQDPELIAAIQHDDGPGDAAAEPGEALRGRIDRLGGLNEADRAAATRLLSQGPEEVRAAMEIDQDIVAYIVSVLGGGSTAEQPRLDRVAERACALLAMLNQRIGLFDTDTGHPATGRGGRQEPDRLELAVATLAAATSVWGLTWTAVLAPQTTGDRQAMVDARTREVLGELETAALLAGSLNTMIEDSPFSGEGSWPLVLDVACQQLGLMIVTACLRLDDASSEPALHHRIGDVRRLACDTLKLDPDPTLPAVAKRAELCTYLWSSLQFGRLAARFAQQFDLLGAGLVSESDTGVGRLVELTAHDDTDRMVADLCRGLAGQASEHLAATYFSRAAWVFLNSDAAADARYRLAVLSLLHSAKFGNIELYPTLQRLVDEFGVAGMLERARDTELSNLAISVFGVLERADDEPLVARFEAAFDDRSRQLPAGTTRDALDRERRVIRLPALLADQQSAAWPGIVATFSDQTPSEWCWVLYLVALHIRPAERTEEIRAALEAAVTGMRERAASSGQVTWNELLLADELAKSSSGELPRAALDVLHQTQRRIVVTMPIDVARDVLARLAANGLPVDTDTHAVLDSRYLQQQEAAVFPSLYRSGHVFPIFRTYAMVLRHYGLTYAESPDELRAWLARDCDAVIDAARELGAVPEPLSRGRLRIGYLRIGGCLNDRAGSLPDDLAEASRRVDELARTSLPLLLRSGVGLEGMPDNVRRVLEHHFHQHA